MKLLNEYTSYNVSSLKRTHEKGKFRNKSTVYILHHIRLTISFIYIVCLLLLHINLAFEKFKFDSVTAYHNCMIQITVVSFTNLFVTK